MKFNYNITEDGNFKTFQTASILANYACRGIRIEELVKELTEVAENAPAFDLGQYWVYPELAATIGLCKRNTKIWSALGEETRDKLALMMEIFLYLGAFATQRNNNYHTGFAWRGNFSKKWNPNVQLSVYPLMVYCIDFFGSIEAVNDMLTGFRFDALMEKVKAFGFERCYACWNTPPCQMPDGSLAPTAKELLENGGTAYIKDKFGNVLHAGNGESIRQPYMHRKGGLWYLPKDMIANCFSGGPCISRIDVDGDGSYDGHILDETVSTEEGKVGMYLEFNTTGGTNAAVRSSLHYCMIDFILVSTLIAYTDEIGWFRLEWDQELKEKITVGNTDLFYKIDHGYRGRGLAHKEDMTPEIVAKFYPGVVCWRKWFEYR